MKLREFHGKVAVVTGATSGIGAALCKALVENGATVVVTGRNTEKIAQVVQDLGPSAEGKTLDVRDVERFKGAVQEIVSKYGTIDYLFNNAGVAIAGEVRDLSVGDWNEVLDVDLRGVVNGVAAVYPQMVRQGHGHIVNIASLGGLIPLTIEIPYTTAKFGVVGLSHALRMEGRALGVKVSVACPGGVTTPIWENTKVVGSTTFRSARDILGPALWLPRFVSAEDAARSILKGTNRNEATIFTNFSTRVLWWIYKLSPSFYLWTTERLTIRVFRQHRRPGE